MDADLLEEKGLNPSNFKLAQVTGYGLRIGDRATLEAARDECAFGSIMDLGGEELELLYGEKSVADYVPKPLLAVDIQGNSVAVTAFILPMEKVSGSNSEYARRLALTARKIGLPADYVDEIETWIH
ncbi:MAG TPA: hypothetical protein VKB27_15810 [Gammaproteobacteria bacterium]|nr:hypothetical protein [Gammaproteobacteria bacterium]